MKKTYLGYFAEEGGYYNYYPLYEFDGKEFDKIRNPREEFPDYGNISCNITNPYYLNSYDWDKWLNQKILALDIDDNSLESTLRNQRYDTKSRTQYKLNIEVAEKSKKINKLDFFNLFYVVKPVEKDIDFTSSGIILVKAINVPENTEVVLEYGNKYYGPFTLTMRAHDKQFYVKPKRTNSTNYNMSKNENSIINCFSFNSYFASQDPVFPCQVDKQQNFVTMLHINSFVQSEYVDCMSYMELSEQFTKIMPSKLIKNQEYTISHINAVIEEYEKALRLLFNVGEKSEYEFVIQNRVDRVRKILTDEKTRAKFLTNTSIEEEEKEKKEIKDAQELLNQIDIEREELRKEKAEIKKQQFELGKLIDEKNKIINDNQKYLDSKAVERKKKEIDSLEDEISRLSDEKYNLMEDIKDINSFERLEEELDNLYEQKDILQSDMEDYIDDKINGNMFEKMQLAFDDTFNGLMVNKMTKASARWEKEKEITNYYSIVDKTADLYCQEKTPEWLVDYVVAQVQKYRPNLDKNSILNMFICITQGFLTIFSGEPGTGKTSMCNIVAHVLGIAQNPNMPFSRFVPIAVERGWNSPKDFIGYYSPLSNKFEKNDSRVYDALSILNLEGDDSKYPMVFLLDEANLSPMEYYFANFMSLCDMNFNSEINLGGEIRIKVPHTLRFIATINNDHTTENLSPRLVDRSFVVSIPYNYSDEATDDLDLEDLEVIDFNSLCNCFEKYVSSISSNVRAVFNDVKNLFKEVNQAISPRTEKAVLKYCSVAQNIFKEQNGVSRELIALDYALAQKVITKISGNGQKYKTFIEDLHKIAQENSLTQTASLLNNILSKGDDFSKYYQFFN